MKLPGEAVAKTDFPTDDQDTEVVSMDQDRDTVEKMETNVNMRTHPSEDRQSAARKGERWSKMVRMVFTILVLGFFFVFLKNIFETYFEETLKSLSLRDIATAGPICR